jgi:hypothetical protein
MAHIIVGYIMPARLMLGLARVASNLLWPLGVMTLTSSFSAPAKTRKYPNSIAVMLFVDAHSHVYSAWNSEGALRFQPRHSS